MRPQCGPQEVMMSLLSEKVALPKLVREDDGENALDDGGP